MYIGFELKNLTEKSLDSLEKYYQID